GSTWTGTTTVRAGTIGYDFSTWVDCASSKIYYVWAFDNIGGNAFFHRAGTLNNDGTITWDYTELQISALRLGVTTPSITKDTAGTPNLWIAVNTVKTNNPNKGNYIEAWSCPISSATNCGTLAQWTNSLNAGPFGSDTTADGLGTILLPLTAGK